MTALAFVQATGNATTGAVSTLASNSSSLTTGNHLFVWVSWELTPATVSIADTAGNTFTALAVYAPGGTLFGRWFYCLNATGNASNVVTASWGGNNGGFCCIRAIELSGSTPTVTAATAPLSINSTFAQIDDPGFSIGAGSALLSGLNTYNGFSSFTFGEFDNQTAATWTEAVSHFNYGGMGYAFYASGAAGIAPKVSTTSTNTYWCVQSLALALGTPPAADTKARVSQVPVEVVRTNTGVVARLSQLPVEVLRINTGTVIRTSQVAVEVLRPNAAVSPTGRPVVMVCS